MTRFRDLFEMAKRGHTYQFTHDPRDADSAMQLDLLKNKVADHNQRIKEHGYPKLQIKLQGKPDPEHKDLYHRGSSTKPAGELSRLQTPRPEHCSKFDVYVNMSYDGMKYQAPPKESEWNAPGHYYRPGAKNEVMVHSDWHPSKDGWP
jgi:hypothetical protein